MMFHHDRFHRIVAGIAAWLVVGATATCISKNPRISEAMTEGHREFERGRYAEALGMYGLAEDLDPERPEPTVPERRGRNPRLPAQYLAPQRNGYRGTATASRRHGG